MRSRRSRPSRTASRRIRRSPRRSRKQVWLRSAGPSTSRTGSRARPQPHKAARIGQEDRMSIVNRRNAVVGFLTLKVGKLVARRKAKQVTGRSANRTKKDDKKNDKKSD